MVGEPQIQFSLTRAALRACAARKKQFLSVSSPPGLGLPHAKGKRNPCEPSTVKEKALRDEASKMQSVSEKKPGVFIVGDGPLLGRAP